MTRPDPKTAERQRETLANLAAKWSPHLDHDTSDGIKAAIGTFREMVEEGNVPATEDTLSDVLVEALRKAYGVDHPGQRYAIYRDTHKEAGRLDDLAYFRVERDLEKALDIHLVDVGTPEFDDVIDAWQALDVEKVSHHGIDFGLRKTLSLMVPIADARLALVTGDLEVEDILAAYPAEPDSESGFAA